MAAHSPFFDAPFALQVEVCRRLLANGLQGRAELIAWAESQGQELSESTLTLVAKKLSAALKSEAKADPAILPAYRLALQKLAKEV